MKVSIEQLEFPSCIKDKILKIKDITKLHIDFISGRYIHFDNTNLSIHEPHRIIISNDNTYFEIVAYNNDTNLYNKQNMQSITLDLLKKIISKLLEN